MAVDMDRLLAQDMLTFSPASGQFDLGDLTDAVAEMQFAYQDEARPERFVLAPDAESRDKLAADRRANPAGPFPMLLNVELHPDSVIVWPVTYDPKLRALSQSLIEWMLTTHACTVENDFGTPLGGSEG
ncbi:MAG TPA: hypothetical protein VNE67_07165 [Acetobacteraceae bacterium]|nr:hypothetical protein [Acetobacteraceae bacterium]